MIIGIGIDICDIERFKDTSQRMGQRFLDRVFTDHEKKKCESRKQQALRWGSYAKRFAAKEACIKALGASQDGIHWHDMEVQNKRGGQPFLILTGAAHKLLNKRIPKGFSPQIHLTTSDDGPYAQAMVIIEAVKI